MQTYQARLVGESVWYATSDSHSPNLPTPKIILPVAIRTYRYLDVKSKPLMSQFGVHRAHVVYI